MTDYEEQKRLLDKFNESPDGIFSRIVLDNKQTIEQVDKFLSLVLAERREAIKKLFASD